MGMGSGSNGYSRQAHDLETQNDDRLEGLMGKVKLLKDVSAVLSSVAFTFATTALTPWSC
jgi:hypothetical protein